MRAMLYFIKCIGRILMVPFTSTLSSSATATAASAVAEHATVARLGSSTSNARGVVWFEFLHFGEEIESGSPSNIKLLLKNKAVASSPVAAVDAATEEAAALTAPAAPEARRPSSRELPNAGTVSALTDRSLYPSVPIYGDRPIQALTLRSIAIL